NYRAAIGTPALALDLNGNENQRAGGSSCSETPDEEDVKGPEPEIDGRLYINRVYHISSERMFQLLFTPSRFMQRFLDSRKVFDLEYTPWQSDGNGNQTRTLTYTITLNNPLIGKFTTATDTQVKGQEGQSYFVQTEVFTHDVPYHDYFFSVHKYFITRTSKHKCRLRVCSNLKYKKQPWGLVKTFIERNSWSGLDDYFKQLGWSSWHRSPPIEPIRGVYIHLFLMCHYLQYVSCSCPPPHCKAPWNLLELWIHFVSLIPVFLSLLHVSPVYQKRKVMGPAVRGALQDSITTLEQLKSSLLLLQKSFEVMNKSKSEESSDH
uniref:GRAM domain containing 1C n=1 Tax=Leptobrachium leishanense TaxID=445787 RepID=A0A8C5MY94_9ANUR